MERRLHPGQQVVILPELRPVSDPATQQAGRVAHPPAKRAPLSAVVWRVVAEVGVGAAQRAARPEAAAQPAPVRGFAGCPSGAAVPQSAHELRRCATPQRPRLPASPPPRLQAPQHAPPVPRSYGRLRTSASLESRGLRSRAARPHLRPKRPRPAGTRAASPLASAGPRGAAAQGLPAPKPACLVRALLPSALMPAAPDLRPDFSVGCRHPGPPHAARRGNATAPPSFHRGAIQWIYRAEVNSGGPRIASGDGTHASSASAIGRVAGLDLATAPGWRTCRPGG